MKKILILFLFPIAFILSLPAALGQTTVGWRGDGTGHYPAARPPLTWSKDKNIVWATPMPAESNASPIIVGDKIFVLSEPSDLICVARADGKILWRRANPIADTLTIEQQAKAKADKVRADAIRAKMGPVNDELTKVREQLKKTPSDKAQLDKQTALEKQLKELEDNLKPCSQFADPPTHPANGYSSATPVSDGRLVYAVFGTGVVAGYDLKGNRRWIRLLEKPTHPQGHSASPLLKDGKLIVHILDLVALDPQTGELLWRTPAKPAFGTEVLVKIGKTDALVTPAGDIVRLSDGQKLAEGIAKMDFSSPIASQGSVYFIDGKGKALRLPKTATSPTSPTLQWTVNLKGVQFFASPLIHAGVIYAMARHETFNAIDAATGAVLYARQIMPAKADCYASVTRAGKYLFAGSEKGTMVVIAPGRQYKEIARNTLEDFRSTPVFKGKYLYLRGLKNLYCLGEKR